MPQTSRIVLFGATGYTGQLTAAALVARGARPLLAGRDATRLARLGGELGGLDTAVADVARPATLRSLLSPGDVLLTTVGPFARYGAVALEAAVDAGAHYLDSTGEAAFIRQVFEYDAQRAPRSALLPAFGYDFVPGNFAAALALEQAPEATRVDIGYFISGPSSPTGMSSGTRASGAGMLLSQHHALRGGALVLERGARDVRSFRVSGRLREASSLGGTEPYALPRIAPGLREIVVHIGWFGTATRPLQVLSLPLAVVSKVPGVPAVFDAGMSRLTSGTGTGPGEEERARRRSKVVAVCSGAGGRVLAEVEVQGVDPYNYTASMLAWGAEQLAAGAARATGALGPVDAFGLLALTQGCAEAGLAPAQPT